MAAHGRSGLLRRGGEHLRDWSLQGVDQVPHGSRQYFSVCTAFTCKWCESPLSRWCRRTSRSTCWLTRPWKTPPWSVGRTTWTVNCRPLSWWSEPVIRSPQMSWFASSTVSIISVSFASHFLGKLNVSPDKQSGWLTRSDSEEASDSPAESPATTWAKSYVINWRTCSPWTRVFNNISKLIHWLEVIKFLSNFIFTFSLLELQINIFIC